MDVYFNGIFHFICDFDSVMLVLAAIVFKHLYCFISCRNALTNSCSRDVVNNSATIPMFPLLL